MLAIVFVVVALAAQCSALVRSDMFAYGSDYQNPADGLSNQLTVNVTGQFDQAALLDSYAAITIPVTYPNFRIFGADLGKNVFINYNGHVTFGTNYNNFNPFTINSTSPTVLAIFAPYFSDNDLRRTPSVLQYRLTTNPIDLNLANTLIRGQGFTTFTSSYCVIATWENLKYYVSDANQRNNPSFNEQNTYQAALCTDGTDGHVIYHYLKMQWARSQDTSTNFATIGWVVKAATADLVNWVAPSSGTDQSPNALVTGSNVNFAGRWMRSQPILSECSGRQNGVYAKDCNTYIFCCNQEVDRTATCPPGTYYHAFTQSCVDARNFDCLGTNFCTGRADGRYSNTATAQLDDFYECKSQLTKLLFCPAGINFGTNSRCI